MASSVVGTIESTLSNWDIVIKRATASFKPDKDKNTGCIFA